VSTTDKTPPVYLETLGDSDKANPYKIAEALENTLHRRQKRTVLAVQFPCLLIGMGAVMAGAAPAAIAAMGLVSAVMLARTVQERHGTVPRISQTFNAAVAGIDAAKPRAELEKIGALLAENRTSRASWLAELNPRKHPLRTPAVAALVAWSLVSPPALAFAAFVMAASMLDQHGDHVQKIREQAGEARAHLRAWRTGLNF
jgi:hypothetical protein